MPRQIAGPEGIRKSLLPPPSTLNVSWTDWETWEASPEILKSLPYYRSGYDEGGHVGESRHSVRMSPMLHLWRNNRNVSYNVAVYVVDSGRWNLWNRRESAVGLKYYEQSGADPERS